MEAQHAYKKEEPEANKEADLKSPDSGETRTPRRALRGRGASLANPAVLPSSPDTNGAGTPSTPGSGRVLRDRSTRSVPLWRRKDLGEEQEEEEEEEEDEGEDEAPRRRKAPAPRRKRNQEAATDTTAPSEKSKVSPNPRGGSRRAQGRSRTPSNRSSRASGRVVCKSEPEPEPACESEETAGKKTSGDEKAEGGEEDVPMGEEEAPFADDAKDRTYNPQTQSEDEEGASSDEDTPYKDDLNDQSYDPKSARDAPKQRRRAPARPRDRKEKASGGEKEKEKSGETEVKTEGTDGGDVKPEVGDGADPPRKRGRRRKDDKSPRLPKRRKKPPVQYVRCEMEGCGTVLAHPRYLQHHIKYQHLMKKKYVCPHPSCGRLFRLQKQLLRHAKHHTDQRDYICEFCARAFKSSHNLAVHRMIHTGEKPLQCEICGFTCRQKASLNWHMKKHDADATYQFSCTICGKKFEKKDSVVAHKAKSHPEVLIAEALAANAGTLVTTAPAPTGQFAQAGLDPVAEQDRSTQAAQAPVSLAPPPSEMDGGGASLIHATSSANQTLQAVHYVSAPTSQQPQQQQQQQQIVHMTFTTLSPAHQLPLLSVAHQIPLTTGSAPSISTPFPSFPPHPQVVSEDKKAAMALWEGGNGNMGGVWEAGAAGEAQVVMESSEEEIQRVII